MFRIAVPVVPGFLHLPTSNQHVGLFPAAGLFRHSAGSLALISPANLSSVFHLFCGQSALFALKYIYILPTQKERNGQRYENRSI